MITEEMVKQAADLYYKESFREPDEAAIRKVLEAFVRPTGIPLNKCRGIMDSRCAYLAHCDTPCNKCGNVHNGRSHD